MDSIQTTKTVAVLLAVSSCLFAAEEIPQADIASGAVRATVYPPDANDGYYRATRFDWSGVLARLEWKGHSYFGKWFDRWNPKLNDAITGPVEEFLTGGAGLGYAEAKPGDCFVKIGVGALRKPDEAAFHQFHTYEICDGGKWTVRRGPDWIEFVQELPAVNGYAYVYRKKVTLRDNPPRLVLEHSLRNTGHKAIETSVYEHDFFMLDSQPTGPDVVVSFPFAVRASQGLAGLAETRGNEVVFLRELARGQTVHTGLEGYGGSAKDYDIRVENRKTGAGVRQTCDRPISKLMLWSIRTTVCPEAYIDLRVEPRKESNWRISYEFYSVH
jgi:hypothetical protein